MLRFVGELVGCTVRGSDADLGKVRDLYIDDQQWAVRHIVVDTGNMLRRRAVLVEPNALHRTDARRELRADLSVEEARNSLPAATHKPVSRQKELERMRSRELAFYWDTGIMPSGLMPTSPDELPKAEAGDVHLRSCAAIRGYLVRAHDGVVGRLLDFLIDDETWSVRHLVIGSARLRRRQCLISPMWVERVDWDTSCVEVAGSVDTIRLGGG